MKTGLIYVGATALAYSLINWVMMILIGNIHQWWTLVPTISFWQCFSLSFWLSTLLMFIVGNLTKD